jgi:hypothetical protein
MRKINRVDDTFLVDSDANEDSKESEEELSTRYDFTSA